MSQPSCGDQAEEESRFQCEESDEEGLPEGNRFKEMYE